MAAAYLFHFVKNHAFNDGNKRIAALTSAIFLEINGLNVIADEDEFEKLVLDAAQSKVNKKQIADFFKKNTKEIKKKS
jgi:death-on-curing protein